MTSQKMTDDDYDTEPYEGPTSSPEEMRYLEQDEAWDNYAQTSAPSATLSRKMPKIIYVQSHSEALPMHACLALPFYLPSFLRPPHRV
jgi:hypothetical protein